MNKEAKAIYQLVDDEIERIIGYVAHDDVHSEKLKEAENITRQMLLDLKNEVLQNLEEQEKTAVWDRLNIAFYGETNSGKSTTVEVLRILYKEKSKVAQRQEFEKLNTTYLEQMKAFEERVNVIRQKHHDKISVCEEKLVSHRLFMSKAAQSKFYNLLNKMRIWFGGRPGPYGEKKEKRLVDKHTQLVNFDIIANDRKATKIKQTAEEIRPKLEVLQDGQIIGSGVPDFTKQSTSYPLEIGGKPVTIIDLPGIEGMEESINEELKAVIAKAHCIFYVVNSDKLPERRTLAKIKAHLFDQVEVYLLLNNRANNYLLDGVPTSIYDLHSNLKYFESAADTLMYTTLGSSYKGVVSIQALLAFLAEANLLQDTALGRKQQKLASKLQTPLLELANLQCLQTIIEDLVLNMEQRIKKVNALKGISQMGKLADTLDEIRDTYYSRNELSAIEQLLGRFSANAALSTEALNQALLDNSQKTIDLVIKELRAGLTKQVYQYIKQPDILKVAIKQTLENVNTFIQEDMDERTKPLFELYREDILKSMHDFQSNLELLSDQRSVQGDTLDFKVNLNYNYRKTMTETIIGWATFAGSILTFGSLGTLLGSWVPLVGNIVGGILGSILGVAVAAWNWLKGERKEEKALRQLENSLRNEIRPQLEQHLDEAIERIILQCKAQVKEIEADFQQEIVIYKEVITLLKTKAGELRLQARELKTATIAELKG